MKVNRYKVYTTDGSEFIATSVKRVKNNAGTGYQVVVDYKGQAVVFFYKTEEITTIMQIRETKS